MCKIGLEKYSDSRPSFPFLTDEGEYRQEIKFETTLRGTP